jgi:hypothetical protein
VVLLDQSLPFLVFCTVPSQACDVEVSKLLRHESFCIGFFRNFAGENKDVLNAFFLGKAVAESVTERVGPIVGELLSDIGRWQSEQQKQIRDFQVKKEACHVSIR